MSSYALINGNRELSGKAVSVARRNAQRMTAEGYEWSVCETCCTYVSGKAHPEAGTVFTPRGDTYAVWLPGVLACYPEGKCDCPFFLQNAICKHIYFAVEQTYGKSALLPAFSAAAPAPLMTL